MRTRSAGEEGSTLLLFPFGVLVLLVLGAITVDAAVVFRADRRALDEAAALADDIAGVIDPVRFAADGVVVVDTNAAAVLSAAANERLAPDLACTVDVRVDAVSVTCDGTVRPILIPALGGRTGFAVGGDATVRAVEG